MTTLVEGDRRLELTSANGYDVRTVDLGFPEAREVVSARPQADGTSDRTGFHGASAVTLEMTLVPAVRTKRELLDGLRWFCHPARRPYLLVDLEGQTRRVPLRADQSTAVWVRPSSLDVQVSWRNPDGRQYSVDEATGSLNPAGGEAGRTYPLVHNRVYPFSSGLGTAHVTNLGNAATQPVLRIYGPAADPVLINETVDRRLAFVGLTIAGGEYVEVDTAARTVRANGLEAPEFSRYSTLDFAASQWWALEPGLNRIRYEAATHDRPSQVEIIFRHAWI